MASLSLDYLKNLFLKYGSNPNNSTATEYQEPNNFPESQSQTPELQLLTPEPFVDNTGNFPLNEFSKGDAQENYIPENILNLSQEQLNSGLALGNPDNGAKQLITRRYNTFR